MIKTCSFTGHRPDSIGGYELDNPQRNAIRGQIKRQVLQLINKAGVDTFISGGALGVDIDSFYIIDDLKKEGYKLKNILAIPFEQQACNWQADDVADYYSAKQLADEVIYVDTLEDYKIKNLDEGSYHPAKMMKRNEYMIDYSEFVIAVWNGNSKGGTANTVRYAVKQEKKMTIIDPDIYAVAKAEDKICLFCCKNEDDDLTFNIDLYKENNSVKCLFEYGGMETYINDNKLKIYYNGEGTYYLQDFTQITCCPKCGRRLEND